MSQIDQEGSPSHVNPSNKFPWALTLGALGVVFGDIGTSPLYALKECFHNAHGLAINEANVLGILSLFIWSLLVVVSIKYLLIVLRADNRGEGGELALTTLALRAMPSQSKLRNWIIYPGLFGAALLYGDGVITPAISVLSAVEGLEVVTPYFKSYVVPITLLVLVGIFYFQRFGTTKIGALFGPIILFWYGTLGVLGIMSAYENPVVLYSLNPVHAIRFFYNHGSLAFYTLGGVFLVVTGAEALYADMGHFGRRPIKYGWFFVAFPGLILNYWGQGALLLRDPSTIRNPFYLMAPSFLLIPLVLLATMATVIASQAVISGAFSVTRQAVLLGYLPRIDVLHTSSREIGQVYVAIVNWLLLIATIALVVEFRSSGNLAAAYGIGVSTTMVVTTYLLFFVAHFKWRWSIKRCLLVVVPFLLWDITFFASNASKFLSGGWVPLAISGSVFILMTTWRRGRQILGERISSSLMPLDSFIKHFRGYPRIAGTAVFMTRNVNITPPALLHNLRHNKVLHERIIMMVVDIQEVPTVNPEDRVVVEPIEAGFYRIHASFGYTDEPDVPQALLRAEELERGLKMSDAVFFLGKETIFATDRPGMALWREKLFAFLSRNALPATNFFKLPTERVVEIGLQVGI
jgi:KUP system potassium uptake protein